jgi:hypothetical protein
MNYDASPGPDGFGPGFYRSFWPTVKQKIFNLFTGFYNHNTDTGSINHSHIIHLPKSNSARSLTLSDQYRYKTATSRPSPKYSKTE